MNEVEFTKCQVQYQFALLTLLNARVNIFKAVIFKND